MIPTVKLPTRLLDNRGRRSALYLGSGIWWSTGTGAELVIVVFVVFFWWFLESLLNWLTVVVGQEKRYLFDYILYIYIFMYKYLSVFFCMYIYTSIYLFPFRYTVPDEFGVVIFPTSFGWHWKLYDEVWRCNLKLKHVFSRMNSADTKMILLLKRMAKFRFDASNAKQKTPGCDQQKKIPKHSREICRKWRHWHMWFTWE